MSTTETPQKLPIILPRDMPQPPIIPAFVIAVLFGFLASHFNLEQALARVSPVDAIHLFGLAAFAFWISMGVLTGRQFKARCRTGVGHPIAHPCNHDVKDPKERYEFLTYQRSIEHALEQFPVFFAAVVTVGFGFGQMYTAATCFLFWCVARYIYGLGYTSGNINKRQIGLGLSFLPHLVVHGLCAYSFLLQLSQNLGFVEK